MGPLLFNIFLTDIFVFCLTEMVSYADDNTQYVTGDCLKKTLLKVEKASIARIALARIANYMDINKKRSNMNAFYISIHLSNGCLTIE